MKCKTKLREKVVKPIVKSGKETLKNCRPIATNVSVGTANATSTRTPKQAMSICGTTRSTTKIHDEVITTKLRMERRSKEAISRTRRLWNSKRKNEEAMRQVRA
jgi:hypothetical protein